MSHLPRTCGAAAGQEREGSLLGTSATPICSLLRAAVAAVARELCIRRDTRRLLEVEPRMLKDIAVARADVERVVRPGRDARSEIDQCCVRFEEGSSALTRWARRRVAADIAGGPRTHTDDHEWLQHSPPGRGLTRMQRSATGQDDDDAPDHAMRGTPIAAM
jgi:uncharacterized protein YjiS (DUF1127 family)